MNNRNNSKQNMTNNSKNKAKQSEKKSSKKKYVSLIKKKAYLSFLFYYISKFLSDCWILDMFLILLRNLLKVFSCLLSIMLQALK